MSLNILVLSKVRAYIQQNMLTYPDAWHVVQQVLSKVIAYIQQNELTKWIKIVYLYEDLNDPVIRALADNLRVIDRCFPKVSPRLPNQLAHLFFLQPRTSSERLHPSHWTHVVECGEHYEEHAAKLLLA